MKALRPLTFGERFTIALIVLLMTLSGGCTLYVLYTTPKSEWLLLAYARVFGGFFFFASAIGLAFSMLIIWLRRNSTRMHDDERAER